MEDHPEHRSSEVGPTAKARHRSPNYPSIGLRAAVGKIDALYKSGGLAALMKITALKQMGFEKAAGDAARLLSALRSYGLIEELGDDRLKLSQRGIDIVARQGGDPQRLAALRAAASGPSVYRDLLTEFEASGVPPDSTLKSELVAAKRFNPNVVEGFIRDFRDTLDFAGLSGSGVVESNLGNGKGHEPAPPPPEDPKIGDYVQWESQGVLKLPEPRRVRAMSDDRQWAFLEGGNAGVPIKELTVVDATTVEKPVEQPPPRLDPLKLRQEKPFAPPPTMRSYAWALSGDFTAKLDLFGEAQTEEDIDALSDYVEATIKALKRSLKAKQASGLQ